MKQKYNLSLGSSKIKEYFSTYDNILNWYFVGLEEKDNVKDVLNYYVFNNDKFNNDKFNTEDELLDKLITTEGWFGYINTLYFSYINDNLLEKIEEVKNDEKQPKDYENSIDMLKNYCSKRDVADMKQEYCKTSPDQKKKFVLKALLKALFKSNATKKIEENIRNELNTFMRKNIKALITPSSDN